jgi:hypothetical protein
MTESAVQAKPRTGLVVWMVVSQLLAVWSYPIIPLALVIGAWIAFARRKNAAAAILSGLSFAPPILCFALMAVANSVWFMQNGGLAPFGN